MGHAMRFWKLFINALNRPRGLWLQVFCVNLPLAQQLFRGCKRLSGRDKIGELAGVNLRGEQARCHRLRGSREISSPRPEPGPVEQKQTGWREARQPVEETGFWVWGEERCLALAGGRLQAFGDIEFDDPIAGLVILEGGSQVQAE